MAYLEVSIKHLIKVDPPHLKIIQGVSNGVTVRGGMRKSEIIAREGMINFAVGEEGGGLKTTICRYSILIKIKISMTCVCKEY